MENGISTKAKSELTTLLENKLNASVYPDSFLGEKSTLYLLARTTEGKRLYCAAAGQSSQNISNPEKRIDGTTEFPLVTEHLLSAENAAALRKIFPFLAPSVIGLDSSAGFGDRLGCATPGHARSLVNCEGAAEFFRPVFAQQSTRENQRTGRNPAEVIDDAMWGVMQAGWKNGYGADADHLKTPEEITECFRNGYTFFTIDPGDHVKNIDSTADRSLVEAEIKNLPWDTLESTWKDLRDRFLDRKFEFDNTSIEFTGDEVAIAAVKYGRAVAHTVSMYRHLLDVSGGNTDSFELEVSVDETDSPTTVGEHVYIASELKRLGVRWNSLAPRFPGRFEKGVDYQAEESDNIADSLNELKKSFTDHAAVARELGPYKLSLHSGSDKFLAYPLLSAAAGSLVHLKTAGTSYLEALRVAAVKSPEFFRRIHQFALERYPEDKATYHVSADLDLASDTSKMDDSQLIYAFDNLHDRQVMHCTFGSVLNHPELKTELMLILDSFEEQYYDFLDVHFRKHLEPFL